MSSSDSRGERSIEDILAAIRTGRPIEDLTGGAPKAPSGSTGGTPIEGAKSQGWPAAARQPPAERPAAEPLSPVSAQKPGPDPVLQNFSSVGLPPAGVRSVGRPAPLTGRLADMFGSEPATPFPSPGASAVDARPAAGLDGQPRPGLEATPPASVESVAAATPEDDDLSDLLGDPINPQPVPGPLAVPAPSFPAETTGRAPSFGSAFAPPVNVRGPREAGVDDAPGAQQALQPSAFDFSAMVPTRESTVTAPSSAAGTAANLAAVEPPAVADRPAGSEAIVPRSGPVVIAAMPRSSTAPVHATAAPAPAAGRQAAPAKEPEAVVKVEPADAALTQPSAAATQSRTEQELDRETELDAGLTQAPMPDGGTASNPGAVAPKTTVNGSHAMAPTAPTASARPPQSDNAGLPRSTAALATPAKPQSAPAQHAPGANGTAVAKPGKDPIANLRMSVAAPAQVPPAPAAAAAATATPATPAVPPPSAGQATIFPPAISEIEGGAQRVRSMEDTVAELLRPMLREWLDANMPRIVEKALRIEIAESVRRKLEGGTKG